MNDIKDDNAVNNFMIVAVNDCEKFSCFGNYIFYFSRACHEWYIDACLDWFVYDIDKNQNYEFSSTWC